MQFVPSPERFPMDYQDSSANNHTKHFWTLRRLWQVLGIPVLILFRCIFRRTFAELFDTTTDYILRDVQSDNVELSDATGLSNDALCFLKKLKYDAETIPNAFVTYTNTIYTIEKLFTTNSGNNLLREIGNFVRCDFTQAYSELVDTDTQSPAPITSSLGFRVNGDFELYQYYRPELFEQSAAELLVDAVRQMKREIQTEPDKAVKKRVRRAKK